MCTLFLKTKTWVELLDDETSMCLERKVDSCKQKQIINSFWWLKKNDLLICVRSGPNWRRSQNLSANSSVFDVKKVAISHPSGWDRKMMRWWLRQTMSSKCHLLAYFLKPAAACWVTKLHGSRSRLASCKKAYYPRCNMCQCLLWIFLELWGYFFEHPHHEKRY